jgi:hypothetical protein
VLETFRAVYDAFHQMPTWQVVFVVLCAGTWLIGGNIVVALHYKRRGKPWWSGLKPLAFPLMDFTKGEALALASTAVIAFLFLFLALAVSQ